MKKIVITGGGGFLGQRLARALSRPDHASSKAGEKTADQFVLVDIAPPQKEIADSRVTLAIGDAADPEFIRETLSDDTDGIFHLAAVVSGAAEADFDLGMRVNLDGTRTLLEACRRLPRPPRLVFTSSLAVFGPPLPEMVTDATTPIPQSSYGTQKLIGELLVADFARKGFIDGRVVRLPTVSIRPGKPNAAASSFASSILREPLNGQETVCPVEADAELWLISPRSAVDCLQHAFNLPNQKLGIGAINLPGITVTVREMIAALEQTAGSNASKRIRWQPDPRVRAIVETWPARFSTARADSLGFARDARGFDGIVADYLSEEGIEIS
jgi:nucleoside-diphosphate-sugar epimerase